MSQMPGMGGAKQETTASATGTVTAIDAAGRKITFNHGPIPEIKWPAMKMELLLGVGSTRNAHSGAASDYRACALARRTSGAAPLS
jgi:hypothetical protein